VCPLSNAVGLFRKTKKADQAPDLTKLLVLPNKLAEHSQTLEGLSSDEIIKLFESLERIDGSIVVSRRRPVKGKNYSKEVGGKQRRMSISAAVEYEKKRHSERLEKEKKVSEMFGIETDLLERDELNDEIYPKRLSPQDIAFGMKTAKTNLEESDRLKERRAVILSPREEMILDALEIVKKSEAARVAKLIAKRQKDAVLGKTIEELDAEQHARMNALLGIHEETEEEKTERLKAEEEQRIEAMKTLQGFDSSQRMLTEEAGDLVNDDFDAAAAIMRQWIGTEPTAATGQ
jgi:hypothetical protein